MAPSQMDYRSRSAPRRRLHFAVGGAAGIFIVLLLGWLTGVRDALHATLILAAAAALLPAVIAVAFVLILVAVGAIAALVDEEGVVVAGSSHAILEGSSGFGRLYYRFLWRQRRHPFSWGFCAGAGLAVVGIWALIWVLVVPLESQTLNTLLEAQRRIESVRHATKHYPAPAPDGVLHASQLDASADADASTGPAVLDAFGRPIEYRRGEGALARSYRVLSLGFDGRESHDDICVIGQSELTHVVDELRWIARSVGKAGWTARAEALKNSRCAALDGD